MIEEAEPYRNQVVLGAFEMERVPLSYVDQLLDYNYLRLVFNPQGIFVSLIKDNAYSAFWWSPERHSFWMIGAKEAWALNVMLSCIWRDACIVRHKMYQRRTRKGHGTQRKKRRKGRKKKLILPRIVTHVAWSSDQERERIIRAAHTVRPHYRELTNYQQTSNEAKKRAVEYGYPEPPEGFTFVKPHSRSGKKDQPEATPAVVCKGLQVANIALSII